MTSEGDNDTSLASKCMAFCQALASQGQAFNFSLSVGANFTFSLDTRSKAMVSPGTEMKLSPSTQRRNARRREEFLKKKQNPSSVIPIEEVETGPTCDQCEYKSVSEKGLRQHKRMKHGLLRKVYEMLPHLKKKWQDQCGPNFVQKCLKFSVIQCSKYIIKFMFALLLQPEDSRFRHPFV